MEQQSSEVNDFAELWSKLTPLQRRFAVSMQEHSTKKDAAQAIGISPNTAYNWNSEVDQAIAYMTNNIALATLGIIQASATKAAMVKASGLDDDDSKIAQSAATEILDRNLGKATQRMEHAGGEGEPISIAIINTDTNKL